MKSLIAILSVAIVLLFLEFDLFAQEKEDDKRLEITGYLGTVQHFYAPCVGLGLEYFISPRVNVDVEINYLPNTAFVIGGAPWGRDDITITEGDRYRLLWDINFLFYLNLSELKRAEGLYFTLGIGYQYDHQEYTIVSLTNLKHYRYGYGEIHYQPISFGVGYKLCIKGNWALRVLYKIHNPPDDLITSRLTLGLSYRF